MTKIIKTMNQPLVLLLFVSLLAFQQARSQDETSVQTRSASSDKVNADGGNQARTIYSQPRYLSPHKMMHFGKRPVYYEPPVISTPIRLTRDLFPAEFNRPQKFLSLEFGSGKTLQEVPDMDSLLYSYVGQPEASYAPAKKSSELERQQRQMEYMHMMDKPRLLNLISNEQASENNNSNDDNHNNNNDANNLEKAQGSSNSQFDEQAALQQQQQQQQQQRAINVNTRSSQRVILPKKYITELLAGNRQNYAQSLPSGFGVFNKKAEPKDNFFMHFGRK